MHRLQPPLLQQLHHAEHKCGMQPVARKLAVGHTTAGFLATGGFVILFHKIS